MTPTVILGIMIYFIVAPIIHALVSRGDKEPTLLEWPIIYLATPASMCCLILLGLLSIPYFTLYPERHAHSVDVFGTEAQKAAMSDYRLRSAERSFVRRCLEFSGLSADTRLPLPPSVIEFEERELAERRAQETRSDG